MKNFRVTLILLLAVSLSMQEACGRSVDGSAEVTVACDSSFTGRGNLDEPLLHVTITPSGECTLRKMKVALSAPDGSVDAISISRNGRSVEKLKVHSWKNSYSLKCRGCISEPSDFDICVDVSDHAGEGSAISATLTGIETTNGNLRIARSGNPGREVLLVRKRLYAPGDRGSKNWRIPAVRQLCNGELITLNDKRKFNESDLPQDIDIVFSHSKDGGKTWDAPTTLVQGTGVGHGFGDPAIVETASGRLIAAFVGGAGSYGSSLETPQCSWIMKSDDHGHTWSAPENLTPMIWGPDAVNPECRDCHSAFFASGNGLLVKSGPHAGRVIFATAVWTPENKMNNYAVYSDDEGETWNISRMAFRGGDESKIAELPDGRLLISVRRNGERGYNHSSDCGETWGGQGTWPEICTNACNGDLIRYNDDILLQSVPNSMKRENVTIFVSRDGGRTWPYHKSICPYNSVYSSMTVLKDGTIGIYLEENPHGGCELWFMNISLDWLLED